MGKFFINYAIVAVLGGLLALNGHTDLGSLASYLVFVRQAALPINQFTQQSNFLLAALAGAERVFKVMDMEPEIDEGKTDLIRVKKEMECWFHARKNRYFGHGKRRWHSC